MRIAISGTSGLIGGAARRKLEAQGHEVLPLVRRRSGSGVYWNPASGEIDGSGLEGLDAIIHLAGENVAAGRWSAAQKARILDSRVAGTALVVRAAAQLAKPPPVLLLASAVGIYGSTHEAVDERSPAGEGFLADVCRQWEAASASLQSTSCRIVLLRFGMVLSETGGALSKMLPIFRMGLGGRLGDGQQYISWISLRDTIRVIELCIKQPISGPVNVVSPHPATNEELTRALAAALRRPALLPVPAPLLRMALGEMAESLLLSSSRVLPHRLMEAGFVFQDTDLRGTLAEMFGRKTAQEQIV